MTFGGPALQSDIPVCNYSHCLCALQRPDEEVVVDQGGTSSVLNIHYEKEELEGEGRLFFFFLETLPSYFSPVLVFSSIQILRNHCFLKR